MVGIELKRKDDVAVRCRCRCRWEVEGKEIGLNLHVNQGSVTNLKAYIVGNKAKVRISNQVFRENKSRQIFRKTNVSYPLICTRMCAYQGVRNVFALLPTINHIFITDKYWCK